MNRKLMIRGMSTVGVVLLIVVILLLVGAFPTWSYSSHWGYGPPGVLGLILIVMVVLLLMGKI